MITVTSFNRADRMNDNDFIQAMPLDVILGRGSQLADHLGTMEFQRVVRLFADDYHRLPKSARRQFAKDLGYAITHDELIPRRILRSVDGTIHRCVEVKSKSTIADAIISILHKDLTEFEMKGFAD